MNKKTEIVSIDTDEEIAKSFIEDVEAVKDQLPCGQMMEFPKTFDEFVKDYGFKDKQEIYTNGAELISVYRVKQWLEHVSSVTPQEPKWIPVTERLPEERHSVLVWCPARKNIYCACYEEKQWWIFGAYWEKITEEVIAWQPLPKPYKEGDG